MTDQIFYEELRATIRDAIASYLDTYTDEELRELATESLNTPALPHGWRLADHRDHGRVIVTTPEPDSGGKVAFVRQNDFWDRKYSGDWCKPDELTYIDLEVDTPTGPDHLAVGTVIESADDPRIAALPLGSILLDRDGEATTKLRGDWTGPGYIPIEGDGGEYGPWTVLHIPKEDDQ